MDYTNNQTAIPPHTYPAWIKLSMVLLLFIFIYSCTLLPDYLSASKELDLGIAKYNKHDYKGSIKHFELVLEKYPSSREANIAIAKSYFSIKDSEASQQGLYYLSDIEIKQYEWEQISKVMPPEYKQYFVSTKKNKKNR